MNETNELFIKYQMMVSLSQFHYNNSTPVTLCFWYLKYSLCIKKQKLQQPSSHNEWNIPVCQWYAMINKAWIMGACESLMIIWGVIRDDTISWRSLSKTTVWLERCYSWCLIAFCRQKKKKKILTNCSPFLLNKPLVNITEMAGAFFHTACVLTYKNLWGNITL